MSKQGGAVEFPDRAWALRQLTDPDLAPNLRAQIHRRLSGQMSEAGPVDAAPILSAARAARQIDLPAGRMAPITDPDEGPLGMFTSPGSGIYFLTAQEARLAKPAEAGAMGPPAALAWIDPEPPRACIGAAPASAGACVAGAAVVDDGALVDGAPLGRLQDCEHVRAECRAKRLRIDFGYGAGQAEPGDLRVVGHGVDSLYVCVWVDLMPGIVGKLVALRQLDRARTAAGDAVYLWGSVPGSPADGRMWQVTWAKPPYYLRLQSPVASIKISKSAEGDGPQVYVEVRAAALWQMGAPAIVRELVDMLHGWEHPGAPRPRVTVSRLDLAVDVVGLNFTGREQSEGRFICRPKWVDKQGRADETEAQRKKRARENRLRALGDRVSREMTYGKRFGGFTFGSRNASLQVVIYDKLAELAVSGKDWFRPIWAHGGWDGQSPVFRVEVRLSGDALKGLVVTSSNETAVLADAELLNWPAGRTTIGNDWWAVRRAMSGIWRYGLKWCSLRRPTGDRRRRRWPVDPRWALLRQVDFSRCVLAAGGGGVDVARQAKRPKASDPHRTGEATRSALQLDLTGITSAEHAAQRIADPKAIEAWGDGIATKAKARALVEAGERAGIDLDVISAEQRAESLLPGLLGMLAAFTAADSVARRDAVEPVDLETALQRVLEKVTEGGEPAAVNAEFKAKGRAALQRAAFTGAIRARRSIVQDKGQRPLPGLGGAK